VKRVFLLLVAGLNLTAADTAWGQHADCIPVVGVLSAATATSNPVLAGLRESLRELGYVEGRNIKLEVRGAEGRLDRLPRLAQELGQLNVDVIVAFNTPAARYGVSLKDAARKLGVYVDKILKGAKAGDLPIEQISKYELVIDLRARTGTQSAAGAAAARR